MVTKVSIALPGLRWCLWLWLLAANCEAFYFLGLGPIKYCEDGSPNSYCKVRSQGKKRVLREALCG